MLLTALGEFLGHSRGFFKRSANSSLQAEIGLLLRTSRAVFFSF